MFLDIIVISFVVALIRGGRLKETPTFHALPFIFASIALQITSGFIPAWGGVLVSISYMLSIIFFYYNRNYEDMRFFIIGWGMNALAIWSNGGKMPIDLSQAKKLGISLDPLINGTDFKHNVLDSSTNLAFFTDIIYMPFPMARVISMGDIFIMIGAFLLIQRIMNKPLILKHIREGKNYAPKS
ncbi:DUF5317 domain-containing protein [Brevibacillus daliensis]|uniref:DUF5317 domain-containing protein n=1 Tax=Brevibacillus daliensis TaxID=2892995 RepID=UPI001E4F941B|nr:DUF5317 domain-containing protein [Brevibacillus daliensis]